MTQIRGLTFALKSLPSVFEIQMTEEDARAPWTTNKYNCIIYYSSPKLMKRMSTFTSSFMRTKSNEYKAVHLRMRTTKKYIHGNVLYKIYHEALFTGQERDQR